MFPELSIVKVVKLDPLKCSGVSGLESPKPRRPLLSIVALVDPPVFIFTISEPNEIPVLLSLPVNTGAEAEPSSPEIPVVPLMFNAMITR